MKNIQVILPTLRDREGLKSLGNDYKIHWMEDKDFNYPYPGAEFDLVKYTEQCSRYIEENHIDGIIYTHDLANLVAGVLCDRHDILGPTLESMFLTNHKYYSRRKETSSIWSDYIDLDTGKWGELDPVYPCYIKPPTLTMTLYQYRVDSQKEMDDIVEKLRAELPPLLQVYNSFFERYVDLDKYPLATKNIMVVEQLVEDSEQHCIEGWFDSNGNPYFWAESDEIYYPGDRKSIDVYTTPSLLPQDVLDKLKEYSLEIVKNHKIDRGFWNVEIWRRGDWFTATEVNGRSASVWKDLYDGTYDVSLYKAMAYLCCGEDEKCLKESSNKSVANKVGGQFHVITYGEGKSEEFLVLINEIEGTDIEVLAPEGTEIVQSGTSGYWLARFNLYGDSFNEIYHKAKEIREKLLLQPEKSPKTTPLEQTILK
ncbi:ATP-grasp domain-containing protein [Rhodohalobacter sp. 8-1]|uniref:ATP-grasp domain-containing protein n=1 Tax=Rhodohalobacter sp. 8-1 TaxID=3131972 RepID=UPI0030EEFE85